MKFDKKRQTDLIYEFQNVISEFALVHSRTSFGRAEIKTRRISGYDVQSWKLLFRRSTQPHAGTRDVIHPIRVGTSNAIDS